MDLSDDELEIVIEHNRLKRVFVDAKLAYLADPDDAAEDPVRWRAYREAKAAYSEHRTHWRKLRDWVKATTGGLGDPDLVKAAVAAEAEG